MANPTSKVELKNVKLPPRLNIPALQKPKRKQTLYTYPIKSAPTVRNLIYSDQEEREFVLAGTGHVSCHSQQKFMIPNKPREKLPKEKPTLFETYHAKPPSQYRRENDVNCLREQPHYHDPGHMNNNRIPHWWWTTQRNRKQERIFNEWLKF
ncbi:uncharacterized protein LOC134824045 [Bolinopsis microptera]|uniref:uncharacterized protein LOC134824045 n=1 Tax=Bolinopsis microptera TaxID=2820187 RepID=UPI00307B05B8